MRRPTRSPSLLTVASLLLAALAIERGSGAPPARHTTQPADTATVVYQPSLENFPNPERGFYRQVAPFFLGLQRYPLTSLSYLRAEGMSLVRAYYVIDEFIDLPLTPAFLDALHADFAAVRTSRVKIIIRFAYSFPCFGVSGPCDPGGYGPTDAPLARVLGHIQQLAPVLQANSDVIAFMEMGFIGAWGEWHTSTNNLVTSSRLLNSHSTAIADAVLTALPADRMAALRYPYHKQSLYGPDPLTAAQAFNGTAKARVGAHNDCFLADATDTGTYDNPANPAHDAEYFKNYLHADNRFVPQGGETCSSGPAAQPYISCANALGELARMRWSTINTEFEPGVIDLWKSQGCYDEIARRLGYRFRLLDATLPRAAIPGGSLRVVINLVNDGWAAPYNARPAELVLRNTATSQVHTFPLPVDPRFWGGGESHTVDHTLSLPAGIPAGTYRYLLHLPDPEPLLKGVAEYSVRLANLNVWESATGFNDLLATVTIGPANPLPGSFGKLTPPHLASGLPSNPTLTWAASAGATSYEVCWDTIDNQACDGAWTSTSSQLGIGPLPLAADRTYFWQVRARNAAGTTDADGGSWWRFTTGAPPPAPFAKQSPAHQAAGVSTNLTLVWTASAGAGSYEVCWDAIDNGSCDGSWTSAAGQTSLGPLALANGTTYVWQVRALNAAGVTEADGGTWWRFATAFSPPSAAPDVFSTIVNAPLQVPPPGVLANDTSNGAGPLTASLLTTAGHGALSLSGNGGFTYTPDAGFVGQDGFTYRATSSAGVSAATSVTITVADPGVAQPPSALRAASIAGSRVTLKWTPPVLGPPPQGFAIDGGVQPGQTLVTIPTGTSAPIFSFDAPDGVFHVRARTLAAGGVSAPSNEIQIFVNAPAAPSTPRNLLALVNGGSLALAWANTYTGGSPENIVVEASGAANVSVPLGLTDFASFPSVPAGTYTLRLRASNAWGASAPSNPVTVTIPGPCSGAPHAPADLIVHASGSVLNISWELAPAGPAPTGFVVHVAGTVSGSFPTIARQISGAVGPGTYTISVSATNPCGASAASAPQVVTIP